MTGPQPGGCADERLTHARTDRGAGGLHLKLALVLALGLVALTFVAPVAVARDPDPCVCPPDPCGPAPPVTDPWAWTGWRLCKVLGGHPW